MRIAVTHRSSPTLQRTACILFALYTGLGAAASAQIVVDGHLDEEQWQQAVSCGEWQRTEPFAKDAPPHANDVRVVATEAGLAAAFIIDQPPRERRLKSRMPRDSESLSGDSVSLMLDFDATGQIGYEFSVGLGGGVRDGLITNQNEFDRDWDGDWRHAIRESEEQWFVELLIPWGTVNMRESDEPTRRIGLYATRYLYGRAERYACPGISSDAAVFLADFKKLEITRYSSATTFDFVPYGTAVSDFVRDETTFKAGADIAWRPSSRFWLAATVNPDFGQVESDELVVDFSAIETVFTDKRPFFTENQGVFELRTPANGQLVYTRRIGAAVDDFRAASSDIDAALKVTGNAGPVQYGAFVAQEDDYDDDIGRLFAVSRVSAAMSRARIGHIVTFADRPLLERTALVNALDFEYTPGEWWRIAGQVIRSDIDDTTFGNTAGYESWLQADLNRSGALWHSLKLLHIDDDFELNDLGYMERNSLRQAEWETNRRLAAGANGRINGENQRLYLLYRENAAGERLPGRVQISREVTYASAWLGYQELRYVPNGVDDLLSRGNGPVQIDDRIGAYFDITTPRYGNWQHTLGGYLFQEGVSGYAARLQFFTSWYATENLTLRFDVLPQVSEDWLLWQGNNLFGSHEAERLDLDVRLDWIPAPRHELRVKWQWIGIETSDPVAYRTDANGNLQRSSDVIRPFSLSTLGLQIRYRYELGPLSELFLVYARGGFDMLFDETRDVPQLFEDMTDVRDADQFLLKFRYRL